MSYLGNAPGVESQRLTTTLTATASQTDFNPVGGYTIGYVDVYLNGVKLVEGSDYTASNGVTVVLSVGAASGDIVEIVTYTPRGLSDGYTKSEADARYVNASGDTMTGALDVQGTVTADGLTANGDILLGTDTDTARGSGFTRVLTKMGSGQSYFELQSNNTTDENGILFSDGSTGNYGLLGYNHANDALIGYTASTERVRIDSSGNVGISSAPNTNWSTFKALNVGSATIYGYSSPAVGDLLAAGTNFYFDGSDYRYETVSESTLYQSINGAHVFHNAGAGTVDAVIPWNERMRIHPGGNISFNSTADVSHLDGVYGVQIGQTSETSAGLALANSSRSYLFYLNQDDTSLKLYDSTINSVRWYLTGAGRVRQPYQPSFSAYEPLGTTSQQVVRFFTTRLNQGGHYNTNTGLFTAPIAGVYFFTFNLLMGSSSAGMSQGNYVRCLWRVNGSASTSYGDTLAGGDATAYSGWTYTSLGLSLVINLAAGDTVAVWNDGPIQTYGTPYGSFSGYLMG